MVRTMCLALVAAVLGGCAPPTPEQTFVNDVATTLGGRDRIAAIKTLTIEGDGTQGNLGQDMTPEAAGQAFIVTGYKRSFDVGGRRSRTEQTRTPNFVYFQGPQAQAQVLGIDTDVAYNVAANGTATRASMAAANDRRAEFFHHPLTIVRLMLDPATKVTNVRSEGGQRLADVTSGDGLALTLAIDGTSHQPQRVRSRTSHPNLGDVTVETSFADYEAVDGITLPTRLTTTTDNFRTQEIHVTKQTLDSAGELAAPAAAASATPATPPAPTVTAEVVAPGVWALAGQSHHSALVELGDHLLLIEAPQSEARTLAVIAKARELQPAKPLTRIVNSHHHFDHSAGIRAAISEGLEVVTHQGNRGFFEMLAARPFTIAPDALAKNPKPLKIATVSGELVLEDKTRTVVLYPIDGNPHGDLMLMAYLPKERLLIQADAFSPGGSYHPYAANLLENIQKRKLRVDRLLPLHGEAVPFAELVKVAQAATATQ
jgi:glyoxylase-like metal-dependent hydrolase (beta-lactamase superfamily II)